MDVKKTELDDSRVSLESSLTYEELKPHFETALKDYRKKVTLPGFRKGKVPLDILRKRFGDMIEESSIEDVVQSVFNEIIHNSDENFRILGMPAITKIDYKPKESLDFKVEFDVMPVLNDLNYKGLELTRTKYEIDDSLVEDEIKYHKHRNAIPEIDGQALDDEYVITVDVQNLDPTGAPLIGESQKGMVVYLGNEQIFPEFREAFRGIKEGETKIIDSTNAEGNPKKVQITCTKVEKLVPPEMNSEFFKKVTGKDGIETEEEFRGEVKKELMNIYDGLSSRQLNTDIISEIVKNNDIPVPEVLVESLLKDLVEDYKNHFSGSKLPENFDEDNFRKERRADAIRSAKWLLARDAIAKKEEVSVEDSDIDNLAQREAAKYRVPADKLAKNLKKDPDVRARITTDKVLGLILSHSKITDKVEVKSLESEKQNKNNPIIS